MPQFAAVEVKPHISEASSASIYQSPSSAVAFGLLVAILGSGVASSLFLVATLATASVADGSLVVAPFSA